tara:strand:+ start:432 stop:809 length:378 start_codon:yes stop_codon:yes gene_type:complete
MLKKEKTMNLETYLKENNYEKKDLTILFSVGCALNVKTGDTFPLMADDTIDFDDVMNVVTDEFDEYWWETLATWNGDKQIVEDTIKNVKQQIKTNLEVPGFEGTMEALEDLVNGVVGEPEYLGGR